MIYLCDHRLYNPLASVGSLSSNPSKNIFDGLTINHLYNLFVLIVIAELYSSLPLLVINPQALHLYVLSMAKSCPVISSVGTGTGDPLTDSVCDIIPESIIQ